jgi:hypothetical protein
MNAGSNRHFRLVDLCQKGEITVGRKEEALSAAICTIHRISLQYKIYALTIYTCLREAYVPRDS